MKKIVAQERQLLDAWFDEDKIVYLETLNMLLAAARTCFTSQYERGAIECLNMMARCAMNSADFIGLICVCRVLAQVYISQKDYKSAITALENQLDLTLESCDYKHLP